MFSQYEVLQKDLLNSIPAKSQKILLVNCGEGQLGLKLKNQLKNEPSITGVLYQNRHLPAAKNNLKKVVSSLDELPQEEFDCILLLDIHLFLKEPQAIQDITSQFLSEDGVAFVTFLNAQSINFMEELIHLGQFHNFSYPYNLSLIRYVFKLFELYIEDIFGLAYPETDELKRQLPLKNVQRQRLYLSLPTESHLFTVFTHYLLLRVRKKPTAFTHRFALLSEADMEVIKSQDKELIQPHRKKINLDTISFLKESIEFRQYIWDRISTYLKKKNAQKVLVIDIQAGALARVLRREVATLEELIGVESNTDLIRASKSHFEKIVPSLKALDLEEYQDYFDCIICLDLHEVAPDPLAIMQKHKQLLKPDGALIYSFQNFQNYLNMRDLLIYGCSAYFYNQSAVPYLNFNMTHLSKCMALEGIQPIESLYFVDPLFPESTNFPYEYKLDEYGLIQANSHEDLLALLSFYSFMILSIEQERVIQSDQVYIKTSYEHLRAFFYENQWMRFWEKNTFYTYLLESIDLKNEQSRKFRETSYLALQISNKQPKRVLDLGCGYGRIVKALKKKAPTCQITGLDISQKQLELARHYLGARDIANIEWVQHDGLGELPFEDVSFDLVFTSGVLATIPPTSIRYHCQEILRVAKFNVMHNEEFRTNHLTFYIHDIMKIYKEFGYECEQQLNPCYSAYRIYWIDKFKKLD